MVDQQRRLDLGGFRRIGRGAVIGHAGIELVAGRDRQPVDESAAPAKADRADLAAAARLGQLVEHRHGVATSTWRGRACRSRRAPRLHWPACRRTATGSRARRRGTRQARPAARRRGYGRFSPRFSWITSTVGFERPGARLGDIGLVAGRPIEVIVRVVRRLSSGGTIAAAAGEAAIAAIRLVGGGRAARDQRHPAEEIAPVHAFMGEAVVEVDRLLQSVRVHRLASLF